MLSRVSYAICLVLLLSSTALAGSAPSEASQARSFPMPPVYARAAIVVDATSGTVLGGVNVHLHLPIASTTKVMTALLALEMGNLTDRITVPAAAFNYDVGATIMGLHPGDVVTLRTLLYGLFLPSGADAANTIAIHYAGSESRFVAMMNHEAAVLGMHDTHYLTAHGLDTPGQYSSAYDLAILGQYVSTMPDLMKIASARSYIWNGHVLSNLNHVIFWYPGADGIKPGWTPNAGLCQVLDARRGNRHVVVAILDTPDMVRDARNLLNFGLRDFTWVQSSLKGDSPFLPANGHDARGPFVYLPGSGHYLRGPFETGFLANGGLDALGFPRTEPLAEGRLQVQYFENGALARNAAGHVTRLRLGRTPVPTLRPTVPPTPTAGTSTEGVVGGPATPVPSPTALPAPPSITPTPAGPVTINKVFAAFQHQHRSMLGTAVSWGTTVKRYVVQVFAYGALAYDRQTHKVWILPVGDRLLAARQFLPSHPGNTYPAGFAPASVLKAIGWLPGRG